MLKVDSRNVILERDSCWKSQGRCFPTSQEGQKEPLSQTGQVVSLERCQVVNVQLKEFEFVLRGGSD